MSSIYNLAAKVASGLNPYTPLFISRRIVEADEFAKKFYADPFTSAKENTPSLLFNTTEKVVNITLKQVNRTLDVYNSVYNSLKGYLIKTLDFAKTSASNSVSFISTKAKEVNSLTVSQGQLLLTRGSDLLKSFSKAA